MKRSIKLPGQSSGSVPFTPAVEANGFIFISGQIASEGVTNRLHTENITVETEKVMENIGAILAAAELGFDNIVKSTIYVTNLQFYAEVSRVYLSKFTGDLARA